MNESEEEGKRAALESEKGQRLGRASVWKHYLS